MGIDYDGAGGIGIEADHIIIDKLVKLGIFSENDWDEDPYDCMEEFGVHYCSIHDYDEPPTFYWIVQGDNLDEINANKEKFIKRFKTIGVNLTDKNLLVIIGINIG